MLVCMTFVLSLHFHYMDQLSAHNKVNDTPIIMQISVIGSAPESVEANVIKLIKYYSVNIMDTLNTSRISGGKAFLFESRFPV